MPKKSLRKTNPYLKDSKIYVPALINNVITSSAVENIHITQDKLMNKNSIRITPEKLLKKGSKYSFLFNILF